MVYVFIKLRKQIGQEGKGISAYSFRSYRINRIYLDNCYHLNNPSIEAWPPDRIEKISNTIDSLNPFEEKRDYFATSILSESINLQFDNEGRISPIKITKTCKNKK